MIPLLCFDFSEDSEQQVKAIGFPLDTDENVMLFNLLAVDNTVLLIKNYRNYNVNDKYQKIIKNAIGKNPGLRVGLRVGLRNPL